MSSSPETSRGFIQQHADIFKSKPMAHALLDTLEGYLLAGPADGCIDKLDAALMYSQIQVFAKLVHRLDTMSATDVKA